MGPREIIIILLIVVLLFGAPKLPELARSIGRSMRILKDETSRLSDDGDAKGSESREAEQPQRGRDATTDGTADTPDDEGRGTR